MFDNFDDDEELEAELSRAEAHALRFSQAKETLRCDLVAGERLTTSLWEFVQRCSVHIEEEQAKVLPDNALIGTLCDAVRLAREYANAQSGPLHVMEKHHPRC